LLGALDVIVDRRVGEPGRLLREQLGAEKPGSTSMVRTPNGAISGVSDSIHPPSRGRIGDIEVGGQYSVLLTKGSGDALTVAGRGDHGMAGLEGGLGEVDAQTRPAPVMNQTYLSVIHPL
jgi:hypothetical protein